MIDPNQAAAGNAQQPGAQAQPKVVCIAALPDGTFMVYPDDDGQDGAGEQDENAEMANGQPAKDVDGALELVRSMLGGAAPAGAPDDQGAQGQDDADSLFQSGFNQARGVPLNRA